MFTLNLTLNGRRLLERAVEAQRELIEPLIDPWKLNPRRPQDSEDYLDCCDILRQLTEPEPEASFCDRMSDPALLAWEAEGGAVDPVEAYYAGGNEPDAILTLESVEFVPAY